MGLLDHINDIYYSPKKHGGLLSHAEKFRDNVNTEENLHSITVEKTGLLSLAEKYKEQDSTENSIKTVTSEQEGLLSLAEKLREKQITPEKTKENFIENQVLTFDITKPYENFIRLCQEANLNKVGLFVENPNGFFLNFAFNLDDVTVQKSKSTKSFWNGTLPETTWQYFQKEELIGFYQLFSQDEIENIYKISFKRFFVENRNFIFFTSLKPNETLNTNYLEENVTTFIEGISNFLTKNEKLEKNCTQTELEANIQEGLRKSLNGQYMELNIVQILKKIDYLNKFELLNIGSHIFSVLKKSVPEPNICIDYPGKIKFVYFANSEIDAQMFEVQIKNNLCNFLNNDILELVKITNYNSTSNAKTLQNLLLGK